MMLLTIVFSVSLALNVALVRIILRAGRRLIQYDDVFQGIYPVLRDYADDLKKQSSGDLDGIMVDHPEVLSFHKRNIVAQMAVESIVDSVKKMTPERKKAPVLPRPDME